MKAIEINSLSKQFNSKKALENLNLTVKQGEIFGFLGPNGAGKSTTINILLDFIRPTSGEVTVLGHDSNSESKKIRAKTGVLPDDYDVYSTLTGRDHVRYRMKTKDTNDDLDSILERVGLLEDADRKAGQYSRGMCQRLVLGMALVGEPELLILDEPSTGLDPNGARQLRDIVRNENERGATVFFSSHHLDQVEAVCDRVGILHNGQLVATDSIEELRKSVGQQGRLKVSVDQITEEILSTIKGIDGVEDVSSNIDDNEIKIHLNDEVRSTVLKQLESAGANVETFSTEEASLEELFAAYTDDSASTDKVLTHGGEADE